MYKFISISLLVFISFSAQAKIYKCKNEYNRTVYQDKPCKQETKVRSQEEVKKLIDVKSQNKKTKGSSES